MIRLIPLSHWDVRHTHAGIIVKFMHKSPFLGIFAGLVASSIWGGMYVISKIILDIIPPFSLLTSRLVLGVLSLWTALQFIQKVNWSRKMIRDSFLVGLIGYGISLSLQFVGTKLSTASNGALVTSATPAFVLLFAPYLLREKNTPRRIFALVLSTLGVIAVIDPRTAELSPGLFWGNMALLGAGVTWALYSVLVRKISSTTHVLASSMVMLAGGLPISLPLSWWELGTQEIGTITPGVVTGILFLGIISTALAMFLWNFAFASTPAALASLTFFAQPVVGTVLGSIFLNEQITPLFMLGGLLIGAGLVVASRQE
jgi:drug/metabolite transporter (DMT)-like permease